MAWEDVVVQLYGSRQLLTPWVPGLRPTEKRVVPLAEAGAVLDQQLMLEGLEQVDLCGLSYGAMVATRLAADFPGRVRRLVLIAGQVRPPRLLMRAQQTALRMVPASRLADAGVSKERLLEVLGAARDADLTDALPLVEAATLVLVGAKDKGNQPGAGRLADGIPSARLRVVQGAGHASTRRPRAAGRSAARVPRLRSAARGQRRPSGPPSGGEGLRDRGAAPPLKRMVRPTVS